MSIWCFLGFHNWFYYDEFEVFDSDRRVCKRCGKLESTYMNTDLGYGYDPAGYVSKSVLNQLLDPKLQLEKYQNALDELIEERREREESELILSGITPTRSMLETRSMLIGAESSLIIKYKNKIRELATKTETEK